MAEPFVRSTQVENLLLLNGPIRIYRTVDNQNRTQYLIAALTATGEPTGPLREFDPATQTLGLRHNAPADLTIYRYNAALARGAGAVVEGNRAVTTEHATEPPALPYLKISNQREDGRLALYEGGRNVYRRAGKGDFAEVALQAHVAGVDVRAGTGSNGAVHLESLGRAGVPLTNVPNSPQTLTYYRLDPARLPARGYMQSDSPLNTAPNVIAYNRQGDRGVSVHFIEPQPQAAGQPQTYSPRAYLSIPAEEGANHDRFRQWRLRTVQTAPGSLDAELRRGFNPAGQGQGTARAGLRSHGLTLPEAMVGTLGSRRYIPVPAQASWLPPPANPNVEYAHRGTLDLPPPILTEDQHKIELRRYLLTTRVEGTDFTLGVLLNNVVHARNYPHRDDRNRANMDVTNPLRELRLYDRNIDLLFYLQNARVENSNRNDNDFGRTAQLKFEGLLNGLKEFQQRAERHMTPAQQSDLRTLIRGLERAPGRPQPLQQGRAAPSDERLPGMPEETQSQLAALAQGAQNVTADTYEVASVSQADGAEAPSSLPLKPSKPKHGAARTSTRSTA